MEKLTLAQRIQKRKNDEEAKKNAPPQISFTEVKMAAWVWQLGVVALDIATAWIVWQITFLFYGIVWILAGAGGLLWSERQRQRVGNNNDQKQIGEWGVNVSLAAIIAMAILSGIAYILGYSQLGWVEALTLAVAVCLFFYHIIQARRFHVLDDEYIERNEEARREAEHKRDMREIARSAREVEKESLLEGEEDTARKRYGDAFDAAYQPRRPQNAPTKPQERTGTKRGQFSNSYASDTAKMDPTEAGEQD